MNRIWSQVGVDFKRPDPWVVSQDVTVFDPDYFYVEDDETAAGSSSDEVAGLDNTTAIDVYIVHSILDPEWFGEDVWLAGTTFYPGMGRGDAPAVIIAAYLDRSPDAGRLPIEQMSRTLAHELGHYVLKLGDNAHNGQPSWNLMVSGDTASSYRLDLNNLQYSRLIQHGVQPGWEDQ